ncbi:MAG: hypothetical protein ACR2O0_12835 [Rhizobiaceae bacterium]
MNKSLSKAVRKFPEKEAEILELGEDEDFLELCDHYAALSKALKRQLSSNERSEFQKLHDQLESELHERLYSNF